MDQRFDRYGQAVCQYIRHATGREKQAIQAELSAHMEDHAQALMDAGYNEDHARNAALTAPKPTPGSWRWKPWEIRRRLGGSWTGHIPGFGWSFPGRLRWLWLR